jgi:hypothetical protein
MRRAIFALLACVSTACAAPRVSTISPAPPSRPDNGLAVDDRVRLAETFRLASAIGDGIWPGWTNAPFAVLLVTPEREFLVRHPRPSADFARLGYDSLVDSEVYARQRTMSPNFLATFPAVGGMPTIVVGQPSATKKSSTTWVLTLLHEHFHQLQMSHAGYYEGVAALGLARGDQSGMWMLNFPFPYDSSAVVARFGDLTRALLAALDTTSGGDSGARWRTVAGARANLRATLTPDDEKYLAFQMWQEGVARYTELQAARWAATHYAPSATFRALPDYMSFAAASDTIESHTRAELRASDVTKARRVLFYPVGAATAMLLDRAAPDWRTRYFDRGYSLDAMLP